MSSPSSSPTRITVQSDSSSGPLPCPHGPRQPFTLEQSTAEENIRMALFRHNAYLPAPVREPIPQSRLGKRHRGESSSTEPRITISGKVPLSTIIAKLDNIETDAETHVAIKSVSTVKLLDGRFYPCLWYATDPSFAFFLDIIIAQGWKSLLEFTGPVCPVEIIQFYSTVNMSGDGLTATVNGRFFRLTPAEFESIFHTPDSGVVLTPTSRWGNLSPAEIGIIKQRFGVIATTKDTIHAKNLSPQQRFLFNVVCRTLTPRLSGRSHLKVFEVLLIDALLQGTFVNLPRLIFHYMAHMGEIARKREKSAETRLPYGVILTRIFTIRNLLADGCPGYLGKDEMTPALLDQMQLASVDGMLIAKQGNLPPVSPSPMTADGAGPSVPNEPSSSTAGLDRILQWVQQTETQFASYNSEILSLGRSVSHCVSLIELHRRDHATTTRLLESLLEDFATLKGEWAVTKPLLLTMMQNVTTIGVGGGRMVQTVDRTALHMEVLSSNSELWNARFDHILSRLQKIDTLLSRRR